MNENDKTDIIYIFDSKGEKIGQFSGIELCLKDIMGFPIEFELLLSDEDGSIIQNKPEELNTDNTNNSFESNFTFENYIVGSSNRFAHAAAMAVADSEITINQYNP